jgi:hypothetical protein
MQRMLKHLGTLLVILVLVSFLGWALWIMFATWTSVDAEMSTHAWVALGLGVFFSCLVGFGLMGLMFFSSRRGYDEPPHLDRRKGDDGQ